MAIDNGRGSKNKRRIRAEWVFAGDKCSRALLEIAPAIEALPLFNPLQTPAQAARRGRDARNGAAAMDPFNSELYAVIHLVLMCWERPPSNGGPLSKILADIRATPGQKLPAWTAKSVNTIIGKGHRSLSMMLAALPAQDPPLRNFAFPRLVEALEQAGVGETWL